MSRTISYLDPGSAAVILQMIGGAAAALAVTLKLYGRKILRALHIGRTDREPVAHPDER
jgi:hypothetical protein